MPVWLNAEKLSAYRILAILAQHRGRRCRPLSAPLHRTALAEITKLERLEGGEVNEAKKVLATEATALVSRPRARAAAAAATAHVRLRQSGGSGSELPQTAVPRDLSARGIPAFELFSRAGLAAVQQ